MATQPEPVAGVAFVDSPSLVLPAAFPTLVSSGGTLGVIAAGSSTVSPIGGGGGVTSIVAGANVTVSGATGAVTVNATSQFGQDTTVSINNSAAAAVTALELIASLPVNTAGSETSQWLVKLLDGASANHQSTSVIMRAGSSWYPNGTQALPGVAFLGTALDGTTGSGYGMWFDQTNSRLMFSKAGASAFSTDGTTLLIWNALGSVKLGTNSIAGIARNSSADLQITTEHDVVIGADNALATTATTGHMEIPTCAGTPTGVVTVRSGKVALIYDTTNFKLAASVGGGTWKQTAAMT